jgi:hypothetical protein
MALPADPIYIPGMQARAPKPTLIYQPNTPRPETDMPDPSY